MVKHFLLFYEGSPDYLERRPQFRAAHLTYAWEAADRSELLIGGALADPVDGAVLLFVGDDKSVAEEAEEKDNSSGAADGDNEDDDDDYNNDQVGDSDEGLRLAKRRQLSSPYNGPPLKRNARFIISCLMAF